MSNTSKTVVNKFGGEIMGSARLIHLALDIIKKQKKKGLQPMVVVSASSGVTDKLELIVEEASCGHKYKKKVMDELVNSVKTRHLTLAEEVLGKKHKKLEQSIIEELESFYGHLNALKQFGEIKIVLNSLMSYGERLSSLIMQTALEEQGIKAKRYTAKNIGIVTDSDFLNANILYKKSKNKTVKSISTKSIPVICGYCGKNEKGHTMVLGRGGTDTTACFLGNAFNAKKIILWKTVNGVLSADPRIVQDAKTIKKLTYTEAAESGKVICEKAMQYAYMSQTPVIVANIYDPTKRTIVERQANNEKVVKMVTSKSFQVLFEIRSGHMREPGFLNQVTATFAKHNMNMNLIRNTHDAFFIVVNNHRDVVKKIEKELNKFDYYIKTTECVIVSIIGKMGWHLTHRFNVILKDLSKHIHLGAFPYHKGTRLEAVISTQELRKVVKKLHNAFINPGWEILSSERRKDKE